MYTKYNYTYMSAIEICTLIQICLSKALFLYSKTLSTLVMSIKPVWNFEKLLL